MPAEESAATAGSQDSGDKRSEAERDLIPKSAASEAPRATSRWSKAGHLLGRLVAPVAALGLVGALIGWHTDHQSLNLETQKFQQAQRDAGPHLRFMYLLLPPPKELVVGQAGHASDASAAVKDYIGQYDLLVGGRGVENQAFDDGDDRALLEAVACNTPGCKRVQSGHATSTPRFLYLLVHNEGSAAADSAKIKFVTGPAPAIESTYFETLLLAPSAHTPVTERLGDIPKDGSLLLPLASLTALDKSEIPMSLMAKGRVRTPLSVSYRRANDDHPVTQRVRKPVDGTILMSATQPIEGGGR